MQELLFVAIKDNGNYNILHSYKLVKDGDKKEYFLKFRPSDFIIDCSCKKFKFAGFFILTCFEGT